MKNLKDVSEGIWILAVVSFITAMGFLTVGLQMFSLSDIFRGTAGLPLADPTTGIAAASINSGMLFWIGLASIVLSLFAYCLGKGLLMAKKWSRIAVGVLAVILFAIAVMMAANSYILTGIAGLAISGLEIWYLFVKKSTKKYFK